MSLCIKMLSDNSHACGSKFDSWIPKLACPVRYQKRPFSNITGDMDEQLSNCHCFSFRLMGGAEQYQMECLFLWHFHTTQGNGRDTIR